MDAILNILGKLLNLGHKFITKFVPLAITYNLSLISSLNSKVDQICIVIPDPMTAILKIEGKLLNLGHMFIYKVCSTCNYLQFKPNLKSQLQSWTNLYSNPRPCGRHFEKRLKNTFVMWGFLGAFFWWLFGPHGPQIHYNRLPWNYFT